MLAIYKQLQNPLTRNEDNIDKARLIKAFPPLELCCDQHFLALRSYLDNRPQKFFDKTAYQIYFEWLRGRDVKEHNNLSNYLLQGELDINTSFINLREINSENWHDRIVMSGDEYEAIRFIDRHIHPTYLRLVEAILTPLVRLTAYFSRLDRGKSTKGLDTWSVMQELQGTPMEYLTTFYRDTIRNGIAHGGTSYGQFEIRYHDKRGNEDRLDYWSAIRLFDDLLDTCNGIAAALKVFYLISRDRGYKLPRELLFEELQEETCSPWWTIEGCIESELIGTSQLIIYARPESRHFEKIQLSVIQTGIFAEYFTTGYDRYFISMHSKIALPGWAAFDGKRLREVREMGSTDISQYRGIIENNLIFYVPRPRMPRFIGTLDSFIHSIRINAPITMDQLKASLAIPKIVCRNAMIHRNKQSMILKAQIVIDDINQDNAMNIVRKNRRRIMRLALKIGRKQNGISLANFLRLGFAEIAIFRRDFRQRRLASFGLSADLICVLKFRRIQRIKSPDILGSTVEIIGKWRIAWNKAWLEESGQHIN